MRARGIAGPRLTRGHISEHARLAGNLCAIPDLHMPPGGSLPRDDDSIAQARRTGHANLRHDEAQFPHGAVVTDLDQVVDLGSRPDDRVVDAAAIDARIGTDLHIVMDDAPTNVRDLLVSAFRKDIAVAIAADPHACVGDDAIADLGARVHGHARVQVALRANRDTVTDDDVCVDHGPVADRYTVA